MSDEKDLKEKYMEFQMNEQQIKALSQQMQEINNKVLELEYIKTALDEIGTVKKKTEILAPLSSGIFIKTELKENDKLLVNVGSQTVVPTSIPDTKKLMDKQLTEIENVRVEILSQINEYSSKNQEIEKELAKITEEQNV